MQKAQPKKSAIDKYLLLAIALVIASSIYWSLFGVNAYNTFHEYSDLGISAYNAYYDIADFGQVAHGLQLLVFGNHISLDQPLLVLPFYYLYQSPITLLVIQAVVLSLTGLIAFIVARDLTGSGAFGLLLCFAWLLNPGMHASLVFDYHLEFFIPAFYILTFYYYMKMKRGPMLLSLILLLGAMEASVPVTLALGVGLAAYEILRKAHKKEKDARLRMAATIIIVSIAALVVYNAVYYGLIGSYSTFYPALPPYLMVRPYALVPITSNPSSLGAEGAIDLSGLTSTLSVPGGYIDYGLVVVLIGFGLYGFVVLPVFLILLSPWLIEAFFSNLEFFLVFYEYYCFAMGAMFVAAVLGMKGIMTSGTRMNGLLWNDVGRAALSMSTILIVALVAFASVFFVLNQNQPSLSQGFLFQTSPSQQANYSQLYSVMAQVPLNASLATQYFIMPHLADRQYIEVFSTTPIYFGPQYVLVDFNRNVSFNTFANGQYNLSENITSLLSYRIVAQNGTAVLYKNES